MRCCFISLLFLLASCTIKKNTENESPLSASDKHFMKQDAFIAEMTKTHTTLMANKEMTETHKILVTNKNPRNNKYSHGKDYSNIWQYPPRKQSDHIRTPSKISIPNNDASSRSSQIKNINFKLPGIKANN